MLGSRLSPLPPPQAYRIGLRQVIGFLAAALAAVALISIGRVSAVQAGGSGRAVAAARSFSNIPTVKTDAVTAADQVCTVSPDLVAMPGMSKTFKLGSTTKRPVVVLFQGEWFSTDPSRAGEVELAIDGVVQPGTDGSGVVMFFNSGDTVLETHGFNFVSAPLAPGPHTATIEWADNGVGPVCITNRVMTIQHG
jgi:hypothetical protein